MRDYVIFSETTVTVAGIEYLVQAGHQFESERSESFNTAWCYTRRFVGEVEINLTLGNLEPGQSRSPPSRQCPSGSVGDGPERRRRPHALPSVPLAPVCQVTVA